MTDLLRIVQKSACDYLASKGYDVSDWQVEKRADPQQGENQQGTLDNLRQQLGKLREANPDPSKPTFWQDVGNQAAYYGLLGGAGGLLLHLIRAAQDEDEAGLEDLIRRVIMFGGLGALLPALYNLWQWANYAPELDPLVKRVFSTAAETMGTTAKTVGTAALQIGKQLVPTNPEGAGRLYFASAALPAMSSHLQDWLRRPSAWLNRGLDRFSPFRVRGVPVLRYLNPLELGASWYNWLMPMATGSKDSRRPVPAMDRTLGQVAENAGIRLSNVGGLQNVTIRQLYETAAKLGKTPSEFITELLGALQLDLDPRALEEFRQQLVRDLEQMQDVPDALRDEATRVRMRTAHRLNELLSRIRSASNQRSFKQLYKAYAEAIREGLTDVPFTHQGQNVTLRDIVAEMLQHPHTKQNVTSEQLAEIETYARNLARDSAVAEKHVEDAFSEWLRSQPVQQGAGATRRHPYVQRRQFSYNPTADAIANRHVMERLVKEVQAPQLAESYLSPQTETLASKLLKIRRPSLDLRTKPHEGQHVEPGYVLARNQLRKLRAELESPQMIGPRARRVSGVARRAANIAVPVAIFGAMGGFDNLAEQPANESDSDPQAAEQR